MKKCLLALTAVLAVLVFAAAIVLCSCEIQGPDIPIDHLGMPESDMTVSVGGVVITSGGTAGELLEKLKGAGIEPVFTEEAESCMFDGKDVTYHFAFGDVFAFPGKSGESVSANIVDEIYVTDPENANAKGIKVGATKDEVIAVFGDGFFMDGARMVYNKDADPEAKDTAKSLYFYLEDDTVAGIGILENLYHVAG